jgi:hypothetical protein
MGEKARGTNWELSPPLFVTGHTRVKMIENPKVNPAVQGQAQ